MTFNHHHLPHNHQPFSLPQKLIQWRKYILWSGVSVMMVTGFQSGKHSREIKAPPLFNMWNSIAGFQKGTRLQSLSCACHYAYPWSTFFPHSSIFCIQCYPIPSKCTKCTLCDIAVTVTIIMQWRPWFSQLLTITFNCFGYAATLQLLPTSPQCHFSWAAGKVKNPVFACLAHRKARTRHSTDCLSTHVKK